MVRVIQALALVGMAAAATTLTDLPSLSTTATTGTTATTATTGTTATTATTGTSTTSGTSGTTTASSFTASATGSSTTTVAGDTGLPTLEGAGIPTIVVPYTADAPYMQKSNLPQGTFFIAVGAVLAFLGACVLLWRVMVAWSTNRSVRRAALASSRGGGSEKPSTWGGSSGYHNHNNRKSGLYKDFGGSSMSLDALTSSGKHAGGGGAGGNKPHFRGGAGEHHDAKHESAPPAGLFFSPTAQAGSGAHNNANRTSSYLPAGYYASPSAQAAGGAGTTTLGGGSSIAPYARSSMLQPSPPSTPGLAPGTGGTRASATNYRASSRDGLRAPMSRDGGGGGHGGYSSRPGSYMDAGGRNQQGQHASGLYAQPSSSSLMVGTGAGATGDHLGGSRAPSAYLEDLFENHGNGPRERFE